ncbi:hypothetical protein ACTFIV_002490 [Dictyostelium citrinum]
MLLNNQVGLIYSQENEIYNQALEEYHNNGNVDNNNSNDIENNKEEQDNNENNELNNNNNNIGQTNYYIKNNSIQKHKIHFQKCSEINAFVNLKAFSIEKKIKLMLPIETFGKDCIGSNECDPIGLDNVLEPIIIDLSKFVDKWVSSLSLTNSEYIEFYNQCKINAISSIIEPLKYELHKENQYLCQFNWIFDQWSNCNNYNNSQCPIRERKVICVLESNHLDFDERNPQCCNNIPKPISSESCGLTYSWSYGEWSNCTGNCGSTFRKANCLDCIGTLVDDSKCSHIEKEPELLSCQPTFGWKESEWIKLECKRGGKFHTGSKRCNFKRNVWCESCGIGVDDSKCHGRKPKTLKEEKV